MKNKHVESNFIVCLDEGSSPSDSTFLTSTLVKVFFIIIIWSLTSNIFITLKKVNFIVFDEKLEKSKYR